MRASICRLFVSLAAFAVMITKHSVCSQLIIDVQGSQTPLKGKDIRIYCQGFLVDNSSAVDVFNSSSALLNGVKELDSCGRGYCLTGNHGRYRVSADNAFVYIDISTLNRQQDERYWTCRSRSNPLASAQLPLTVYTLPTSLYYPIAPPTSGQDLAFENVILNCESSCSYPRPTILWFFLQETDYIRWSYPAIEGESAGQCLDSEQHYRSTLTLSRFTTFVQETPVRFRCGIINFPGMTNPIYSGASFQISVPVIVKSVQLRQDAETLTDGIPLVISSGFKITLTCYPSSCRPEATIAWYIGLERKQLGQNTSFIFNATNNDHNKQVYCKAFNFGNESLAVLSGKPTLFVKVTVTSVILMDGTSTPTTTILVTENEIKTLSCNTSLSRPAATVVWYIGDKTRQHSSANVFTFTPTNDDHNKQIYCKAFNTQPEDQAVMSAVLQLYVRVPASQPSLTNQTFILLSGDTVTLECLSSVTRPPVTVIWRLGNTQLDTVQNNNITIDGELFKVRSVLTYVPKNSDNSRNITCETYVAGLDSKFQAQTEIKVYWPPSQVIINKDTDFPWFEGDTGKYFDCVSFDNGNPAAEATWITTVDGPTTSNKRILQMPPITSKHNGADVKCVLTNEYTKKKGTEISNHTTIIVEYYPVITVTVDDEDVVNVTKIEGQKTIAICSASGNPIPKAQWTIFSTKQLVFNDINRTNDGTYDCEATAFSTSYGTLSSRKQLNIRVFYPPTVSVKFSPGLQEQMEMTIHCGALGKPDNYTFTNLTQTWNGVFIKSMKVQQNGDFVISNATIQDSGTYTCFVNNGIPNKLGTVQQSGTSDALVKGKPKLTFRASSISAGKIGEPINITIPFYSYPDIKQILFKNPNGTVILSSPEYDVMFLNQSVLDMFHDVVVDLVGHLAVLFIANQHKHDFGNYTLTLSNNLGTTSWQFRHISRSIPQAPERLWLIGIVKGVPVFLLSGGFNGGLKQTFVVETSVTDSDKWDERLKFQEDDTRYIQPNGSYLFNISGLGAQTYIIRVTAENEIGRIEVSQGVTIRITIEGPAISAKKLPVAAIAGGIGSAAVVIIVGVIVVIVLLRKKSHEKGESKTELHRKGRLQTEEDSSDEDVMVENKMYESAGQIMTTDEPVYNQPTKKVKADTKNNDVYAVVDKTKGKRKENQKVKKGNPKQQKNSTQGDIYENAPEQSKTGNNTFGNAAFEDNPYENPEGSKPCNTQKKNINPDGLIYADLAFNDQPKGQKKLVIHGLDDMTTYVQVDFNRKADPLPDSDTEEQSENKKH